MLKAVCRIAVRVSVPLSDSAVNTGPVRPVLPRVLLTSVCSFKFLFLDALTRDGPNAFLVFA